MSIGTIYSYPQNPRVIKALVCAKYNGLEVKVDDKFEMGKTNTSAEFIEKFGASQVPAFEGADGLKIIESGAIAYYRKSYFETVAHYKDGSSIVGKTKGEEALIQQWVHFADQAIGSALGQWLYPIMGYAPYNKVAETAAIDRVKQKLQTLERHLIKKTYLVGERVTLADISAASVVYLGYKLVFDAEFRKTIPAVTRWFTTIINQPNWKAVAGDFAMCETAAKYVAPKKEAKKEDKPKVEKPKEEKKPKKAEKKEEEEDDIPKEAPRPKSKLESLPPAKMPLDEWKRQYSNNDTPVAMKWLWETIDLKEDYSFWKVDYKYNDELTQLFMSSNLAGGLMNRLERARKYAFGVLVVAGENNNNIISGYFIVRGNADEMIEEITDAADYDSYTWEKIVVDDEAKAKIGQVFAWEGEVNGKKIYDGKVFK
ncbi:Elongation factor 1-gamma [Actinomortierella ambigua]|nr:Elongation factor 1-gamma [Actinomortierella ambigua]